MPWEIWLFVVVFLWILPGFCWYVWLPVEHCSVLDRWLQHHSEIWLWSTEDSSDISSYIWLWYEEDPCEVWLSYTEGNSDLWVWYDGNSCSWCFSWNRSTLSGWGLSPFRNIFASVKWCKILCWLWSWYSLCFLGDKQVSLNEEQSLILDGDWKEILDGFGETSEGSFRGESRIS